LIVC